MNKQTDLQRVMASVNKSDRAVVVTDTPQGKVLQWHEQSPRMFYDHSGKHIQTRGVDRESTNR